MKKQDFIGKNITKVQIAQDKKAMLLIFDDDKKHIVRVDGECCSDTWIEHIELPTELPAKILKIEDLDMNREDEEVGEESIAFYGCKVTTDKGDMVIDYRNSSNGYYGGNIEWDEGDRWYSGGVFGQNISKNEWTDVI